MAAPENTRNVCGKLRLISGHVAAGPGILPATTRVSRGLFSTMSVWVDSATAARSDELAKSASTRRSRSCSRASARTTARPKGRGAVDAAARLGALLGALEADPFAALGLAVGPECDDDALDLAAKRAFRRLALQYHPDKREGGKTAPLFVALHRVRARRRRARARALREQRRPPAGGARGPARDGAAAARATAAEPGAAAAPSRARERRAASAWRRAGRAARDVQRGRRPRERRAPRAPAPASSKLRQAGERRAPSSARSAGALKRLGAQRAACAACDALGGDAELAAVKLAHAWPRCLPRTSSAAPPLWSRRHVSGRSGARAPRAVTTATTATPAPARGPPWPRRRASRLVRTRSFCSAPSNSAEPPARRRRVGYRRVVRPGNDGGRGCAERLGVRRGDRLCASTAWACALLASGACAGPGAFSRAPRLLTRWKPDYEPGTSHEAV